MMSARAKAITCWVALTALALLNPSPTGGALLLIGPLGVLTFYTTSDWVNQRTKGNTNETSASSAVHRHDPAR